MIKNHKSRGCGYCHMFFNRHNDICKTCGKDWSEKPKKTIKKVKRVRKVKVARHSGFLCEDNIVGCTCNQSASVGQ